MGGKRTRRKYQRDIQKGVTSEKSKSKPIAQSGVFIRNLYNSHVGFDIRHGFDTGLRIEGGASVNVGDSAARGETYGIYQGESGNREGDMVKIVQNGKGVISGGKVGVSVPSGSTMELIQNDDAAIHGGETGFEERDDFDALIRAYAPQATPEAISDAIAKIKAVGSGDEAAKKDAVKQSKLWAVIKDLAPDILAICLRGAVKAATGG